jgi:hypothetical protein
MVTGLKADAISCKNGICFETLDALRLLYGAPFVQQLLHASQVALDLARFSDTFTLIVLDYFDRISQSDAQRAFVVHGNLPSSATSPKLPTACLPPAQWLSYTWLASTKVSARAEMRATPLSSETPWQSEPFSPVGA